MSFFGHGRRLSVSKEILKSFVILKYRNTGMWVAWTRSMVLAG